jgi:hypothetical protein
VADLHGWSVLKSAYPWSRVVKDLRGATYKGVVTEVGEEW